MLNRYWDSEVHGYNADADSITLKKINDEGHGWIVTSLGMLKTLDLTDKISSYSYIESYDYKVNPDEHLVYLEEDSDYTLFANAVEDKGLTINLDMIYVEGEWSGRTSSSILRYDANHSNQCPYEVPNASIGC
jgi:hypothetical protein